MLGVSAIQARLRGLAEKKIKAAAASALNVSAYAGSEEVKREMDRVFDRVTPWVKGGVRYVKAGVAGSSIRVPGATDQFGADLYRQLDSDKLTAVIDFDKWGNKTNVTVEKVLLAEIMGGQRKYKRHELALQRVGVLPAGMAIVPGPGAKRDQYGNMKSAQIVQIVSWFQGFEATAGARQNMTDKTKMQIMKGRKVKGVKQRGFELFVIDKQLGKLHPGIYMRKDYDRSAGARVAHLSHGGATALMYFVQLPKYRKRLDFYGVAEKVAVAEFNRAFPLYLNNMLTERGL
ncbi:hypothetical protein GBK02_09120 [Dechloromonas sp. TW-R-39-2]|nr:hypothetical protein GBK02_09120 [Dechloromonas sp. TW-R-39-2]